MLSESAFTFIEHLAALYKQTGNSEFNSESYMHIPNHEAAIQELVDNGYLIKKNNIVGTISINFDALRD